jgi:hypothetical protein
MKTAIRILLPVMMITLNAKPLKSQWVRTNGPAANYIGSLFVHDRYLHAGTGSGSFITANNGDSWSEMNNGLTNLNVTEYTATRGGPGGDYLFAATWGGVFRSTNNGNRWFSVSAGITEPALWSIAAKNIRIYAGSVYGAFCSTNNGDLWVSSGLNGLVIYAFEFIPTHAGDTMLCAGTFGTGVYISRDDGTNWNPVNSGLTNNAVFDLAVQYDESGNTNLFAGTNGGVFVLHESDTTWNRASAGLTNSRVLALSVKGVNIFAGTEGGGVFLSTNNGEIWKTINENLTNEDVSSLAISDSFLFAGTIGSGVYRRPLAEIISSASESSAEIPARFCLKQNYPNPFRHSTTIEYELSEDGYAVVKVYDLFSREIITICDGVQKSGRHEMNFDGKDLPAGTYIYKLETGSIAKNKIMSIMK